jgi:hypothetical protein
MVLSKHQHLFYQTGVTWVHQAMYAQVTLAGFRLLGKKVTFKRLVSAYLACTCNPERLFST